MSTNEIKQFCRENYTLAEPQRIEWIDDTSANIIYADADTALQALNSFSAITEEETASASKLYLRSAKGLSSHPESILQVRIAVQTDKKKPKAHEASRFYLMHPEYDPREQRLREGNRGGRRGGRREPRRVDDSDGEYRRRRFDDNEHRRRKDRDEGEGFDVNMYDDAPSTSRDGSDAESRGRQRGRGGRSKELFPDDAGRASRDRSASPTAAMDREPPPRRFRDRSQPAPHNPADSNSFPRANEPKELFPTGRELFPNKLAASKLKKELFNQDMTISNHRRSDAFDAAKTAEQFSRSLATPFVDGPSENMELFPDKTSVRGSARGISIKGAANVRELFPSKYGENAGKELFSDKLDGRGGRRRKAEDMFA